MRDRLGRGNISASGIAGERWLAALVRDGAGDLMGGAVGRVWGAVLELAFSVGPRDVARLRHRQQVSEQIEQHGAGMGCKTVITDTFSFQAPEFYRKHGYDLFGIIEGYPEAIANTSWQDHRMINGDRKDQRNDCWLDTTRDRRRADETGRLEPVWQRDRATFVLPGFPAALAFTCAAGHLAERADHHPDILIQYRKVT